MDVGDFLKLVLALICLVAITALIAWMIWDWRRSFPR